MSHPVYTINKGINRPLEFRGLKGQYIGWLAGGLVGLLLSFAVLYIGGVPLGLCIGLVFVGGGVLFRQVYRLSKRYGRYGMMKKRAAQRVPRVLVSRSRRVFMLRGEQDV